MSPFFPALLSRSLVAVAVVVLQPGCLAAINLTPGGLLDSSGHAGAALHLGFSSGIRADRNAGPDTMTDEFFIWRLGGGVEYINKRVHGFGEFGFGWMHSPEEGTTYSALWSIRGGTHGGGFGAGFEAYPWRSVSYSEDKTCAGTGSGDAIMYRNVSSNGAGVKTDLSFYFLEIRNGYGRFPSTPLYLLVAPSYQWMTWPSRTCPGGLGGV